MADGLRAVGVGFRLHYRYRLSKCSCFGSVTIIIVIVIIYQLFVRLSNHTDFFRVWISNPNMYSCAPRVLLKSRRSAGWNCSSLYSGWYTHIMRTHAHTRKAPFPAVTKNEDLEYGCCSTVAVTTRTAYTVIQAQQQQQTSYVGKMKTDQKSWMAPLFLILCS